MPPKTPSIAWPTWWLWDLEITSHVERRMEDREFNEVELREMRQHAIGFLADHVDGRFIIHTAHGDRPWHVIVEPDVQDGCWSW